MYCVLYGAVDWGFIGFGRIHTALELSSQGRLLLTGIDIPGSPQVPVQGAKNLLELE